jgi:hypothetical protein
MAKAITIPVKKKAAKKKVGVNKTAPKKAAADTAGSQEAAGEKKPSINIKYQDKSAGQPELVLIFEAIKKMMEPYNKKGALVLHADKPSTANLISHKPVVIEGRKKDETWFVSALVQKGYVGFYYMPIYMYDELKEHLSPELMKCLKGKACFHIKKNDPVMMDQIRKAIKVGYESYKKRGWL